MLEPLEAGTARRETQVEQNVCPQDNNIGTREGTSELNVLIHIPHSTRERRASSTEAAMF